MTPNQYTFRYRVRNWSDYNRALIARGRLTFWFDEDAVAAWRNADPPKGPGAPKVYSDTAIQCALILKSVFQLSLRSTQGFVSSLLELLRLDLPVPDYSTLSRRQSSLATFLTVSPSSRPRHVVVDATGLRVYGSGEGHVRKHRHGRRRAWRKLHLGVDERTKEIVAVEVTPSRVHDCRLLPALLDQIPGRIVQVSGDGAYDTRACYQSILEREAVATIPPRRSARLSESVDPPAWRAMRDAPLREIRRLGRYEWRISSGCTRQSLAENAMSRFKTLFGPKLSARRFDNQRVEAIIKCEVLNRMSSRACLSQCEFDSIQTGLGSVRDPTGIVQQRSGNPQTRLRNQMRRLFHCTVSLIYEDERGAASASSLVADRTEFWWNERKPDEPSLWESKIRLGEDFFNEIINHPVPLDMNTLTAALSR